MMNIMDHFTVVVTTRFFWVIWHIGASLCDTIRITCLLWGVSQWDWNNTANGNPHDEWCRCLRRRYSPGVRSSSAKATGCTMSPCGPRRAALILEQVDVCEHTSTVPIIEQSPSQPLPNRSLRVLVLPVRNKSVFSQCARMGLFPLVWNWWSILYLGSFVLIIDFFINPFELVLSHSPYGCVFKLLCSSSNTHLTTIHYR